MKKILLFLTIIILQSCAKPLLTNSHNGKYEAISTNESPIGYKIGILPLVVQSKPEPEKPKTFFDLKDTVQIKFLDIISKNTKSNDEIIKYIKQPLSEIKVDEPTKKKTDFTKITLRLSFTHFKEYLQKSELYHPNTRLEFLNTKLRISNDGVATFYSIDKLENEFDIIDLGTLSRTKNVNFGANITSEVGNSIEGATTTSDTTEINSGNNSFDINNNNTSSGSNKGSKTNTNNVGVKSGITANGKVSYDNTEEIKEQVNVSLKRLKTGFAFDENSLIISQRGKPLNDIVDGTIVTATFILNNVTGKPNVVKEETVTSFDKLWNDKNEPNDASKLVYNNRLIKYNEFLKTDNKLKIEGTYDGLLRIVANKNYNNNNLEYDDKVTYSKFVNCLIPPIIVDLNNYSKKVFRIAIEDKKKGVIYTLHFISREGADSELLFFQDDNYNEFVNWLVRIINKNDKKALVSKLYTLYLESNKVGVDNINVIGESIDNNSFLALKNLVTTNYFKVVDIATSK